MNRAFALLAEARLTPWAIRAEVLDALKSVVTSPGFGRSPNGQFVTTGATLTDDQLKALSDAFGVDVSAAVSPATERATFRKAGSVAYIPCKGVVQPKQSIFDYLFGGGSLVPAQVVAMAKSAWADDSVKAIVFGVDSPGGNVLGVHEGFEELFALRGKKPMVAQVEGQMCSAAYHLLCAAEDISAAPTSQVGALGVYMTHSDWSGYNEQVGVKFTYIAAGAHKVEGNPDEPLADDARAHLQEMTEDYMTMFMKDVARGRGLSESVVRGEQFGQGRAYIAERARGRGMADKVRTLDATLAAYGAQMGAPQVSTPQRRSVALARRHLDLIG